MNNPVSELLNLSRVPSAVASDIRAIAEAAVRVAVIEGAVVSLLSELQVLGAEITRLRSVLEPEVQKVSVIERSVTTMDRRTAVIERSVKTMDRRTAVIERTLTTVDQRTAVVERTLLDLKRTVDAATDRLPDDDDRGVLVKAKDAITGG